ncbi:hypothetical protein ACES2J_08390 [Bdellovibrio bacteriovorus]|uniref:hypothetical protein n=1 Tax=Bdellovibrio bacteriovorus TaxID=959 RepID=UPI0035A6C980
MGFFVYANKNKVGWRLLEKTYAGGDTLRKTIPKMTYKALGFREDMSLDEARERAKQLNKQSNVERRKIIATAARVEHEKLVDSAYLPKIWVKKFEEHLRDITYGNEDRIDTILKHWHTVQRIVVKLELDPKDFYESRHKIYRVFISKQYSADYTGRILRVFNLWGHFLSRQHNTFFQPIPPPRALERQKLVEAREEKTGVRREADPLTQDLLKKSKDVFKRHELEAQWIWLYIACWFGLRPTEVDGLHDKKNYTLTYDKSTKSQVIMIYQSKLTSIPKDKRWKPVPIFFKEQEQALAYVQQGNFKRPLAKTLRKYIAEGIDNYSPRKAFTDLMLEKGVSLEDAAIFLGHRSIETTWRHYKDKFTFKRPS